MKYLLFSLLSFYGTLLYAQNPAQITIEDKKMDTYLGARKPATLTVQLKNLPEGSKKVDIKYILVQFGTGFQTTKYAETDAGGMAKLVLDGNLPYQQIWLSVGNYLYAGIYVNEGLTVSIDAQKTAVKQAYMIGDGVEYSGRDGELNIVMNKNVLFKKQERENIFERLRKLRESRNKSTTDSFLSRVDSIRQQLVQIDNEFIAGFPKYSWAVKNETMSELYGNLCISYWGDVMPDKLFAEVSNHKPYFTSNSGVLFYEYLHVYAMNKKSDRRGKGLEGTIALFDSTFTPQKSDVLKLFLLKDENATFTQSYPLIINSIQTKWCKKIARDELTKANIIQKNIDSLFASSKKLETADIGKPLVKLPFEADLYQIDTLKNANDFILSLKSKFANKALIIDFWATWCAPCLSDLPSSKSLHEENKDLPIEYIYLCTTSGSNIDLWKNKVAELQIPGTHIFVNEKIIDQLKTTLNAGSGFPSYVVIDANGKVNTKAISRMEGLNRDSVKKAVGL
ncbi:TlpA disulfide reductase family protein [Mucilaginibacter sp.]|uniref:TlpA family protein disulfide reductase n=1 Tax=Mucilaginibacter sp. TaxID=1882438 RepID=UPI002611F631|nr:TlpA disulfide reductase family protein [Mucilaginibacter sp.]MDB5130105.1 hypothetical protein [Mucilaginibacter sp.]